jgi:hypothetical protein
MCVFPCGCLSERGLPTPSDKFLGNTIRRASPEHPKPLGRVGAPTSNTSQKPSVERCGSAVSAELVVPRAFFDVTVGEDGRERSRELVG